jgi:hypothetical protein
MMLAMAGGRHFTGASRNGIAGKYGEDFIPGSR